MELRQLRYFCAVAEEHSFARAARRLFVAQPALSTQIRHLEEELKVRLLRRTTRTGDITHAGTTFYTEARAILDRVDAAGQHAQDAERGVVGTLRVAFLSNVATARLGSLMRLYRERFPQVNLALMEAPTHRQIELLLRGEIDAGLLRVARQRSAENQPATAGVEEYAPTPATAQEITPPARPPRPLPPAPRAVHTFAGGRGQDQAPHLLQFIETLKAAQPRR